MGRVVPQVVGHPRVLVAQAVHIGPQRFPHGHGRGLRGQGLGRRVGLWPVEAWPIRHEGGERVEGRVGAGGGEDDESRHAAGRCFFPFELLCVEQRQCGLVGDAPVAEVRPAVADARVIGQAVETVERALGPGALQTRHPADGAVAVAREMAHQRGLLGGQQQVAVGGVARVHTGQQARVRQPGRAAERGRGHARADHVPPAGEDRLVQRRARGRERRGHGGLVETAAAVGLGEHQQHVGRPFRSHQAGEIPVERGALVQHRIAVHRPPHARQQFALVQQRGRERQREEPARVALPGHVGHKAQREHGGGGQHPRARSAPGQAGRQRHDGRAHQHEEQHRAQQQGDGGTGQLPGRQGLHRQLQQLAGVAPVPVHVDRPTQHGRCRHVGVARHHQREEAHGQARCQAGREAAPPGHPCHQRHHGQAEFVRQARHVEHAETGPAILEGQQRVEQREGQAEAQQPRERRRGRCPHWRTASNSMISGTSSPTQPLATA